MTTADAQVEQERDGDHVVRKSITVPLHAAGAFQLWTDGIHTWWPAGHSLSGDPATRVVLEHGVGGRFFERAGDGIEHEWGRILVWEPPHRLAYHWYLGSGPTQPTRVDVHFVEVDRQWTQVNIEHRGPALIGNLWWLNNTRYQMAWEVASSAYHTVAAKANPQNKLPVKCNEPSWKVAWALISVD